MTMRSQTDTSTRRPLDGIKVIEVGVWHAGPGASAILGDMGADVIKVETFDGDPERVHGTFGPVASVDTAGENWTSLYEFSNRNKRSICLDVRTADGRELLDRLLSGADILVTNLKAASRQRIGLDYDSVHDRHPHIVQATVSGFGQTGPLADAGGFDPMGQGVSGLMYLASDEPQVMQMIVLDQMAAITAAFSVVTALFMRERDADHSGQEAHSSLYGAATWLSARNLQVAGLLRQPVSTAWNRRRNPPLRSTFKCSDGLWIIGTNHPEEKYWPGFCNAIGHPELETDPRFLTKHDRADNAQELYDVLDPIFETRTQQEWVAAMRQHGVLYVGVQRSIDVLSDPQALQNGYVVDFDHEDLGEIRMHGFPIQYSDAVAGPITRAPRLGEHTDNVLAELGLGDPEIDELRTAGVVQ